MNSRKGRETLVAWFEKDETFLGTLSESHRMRVLGFSEDTVSFLRALSALWKAQLASLPHAL